MTGRPDAQGFTVRQAVWIAAPPERVYRALTGREDLVRWFASEAEVDARPGGAVRFSFASCGSESAGTFVALEPGRKVSFTFGGSLVTFLLEARDGGTLVRLTDEGLPRDIDRVAGQAEGWAAYLCACKVLIETGRDLRADQPPGTILQR
jgi:uncharacterized protein YndB with AHSA1/START domain